MKWWCVLLDYTIKGTAVFSLPCHLSGSSGLGKARDSGVSTPILPYGETHMGRSWGILPTVTKRECSHRFSRWLRHLPTS